jgi:hypothetical protein
MMASIRACGRLSLCSDVQLIGAFESSGLALTTALPQATWALRCNSAAGLLARVNIFREYGVNTFTWSVSGCRSQRCSNRQTILCQPCRDYPVVKRRNWHSLPVERMEESVSRRGKRIQQ